MGARPWVKRRPLSASNSARSTLSRSAGASTLSAAQACSLKAPPKPSIACRVWLGSTVTRAAAVGALLVGASAGVAGTNERANGAAGVVTIQVAGAAGAGLTAGVAGVAAVGLEVLGAEQELAPRASGRR